MTYLQQNFLQVPLLPQVKQNFLEAVPNFLYKFSCMIRARYNLLVFSIMRRHRNKTENHHPCRDELFRENYPIGSTELPCDTMIWEKWKNLKKHQS